MIHEWHVMVEPQDTCVFPEIQLQQPGAAALIALANTARLMQGYLMRLCLM